MRGKVEGNSMWREVLVGILLVYLILGLISSSIAQSSQFKVKIFVGGTDGALDNKIVKTERGDYIGNLNYQSKIRPDSCGGDAENFEQRDVGTISYLPSIITLTIEDTDGDGILDDFCVREIRIYKEGELIAWSKEKDVSFGDNQPGCVSSYDFHVTTLDMQKTTSIPTPTTKGKILFDNAHNQVHSINSGYLVLANCLKVRGFSVDGIKTPITYNELIKYDIFVIPSAYSSKFSSDEINAIHEFVGNGGGLLIMNNDGGDPARNTNQNDISKVFGVTFNPDRIKDPTNHHPASEEWPLIRNLKKEHDITKGVKDFVFYWGCSLSVKYPAVAIAWTASDFSPKNTPVIAISRYGDGRVICIGDDSTFSDFDGDENSIHAIEEYDNKQLAMGIFNWLLKNNSKTKWENWQYQKEIIIKENSGKTLTDYQVFVELRGDDFPSKAKPDGADIRFTDAEGKELSYWIESWDYSGKDAKIWVKVPRITANGETKITTYFGNPSTTSLSKGDKVFEFFDDFEGTGLDTAKWDFVSLSTESGKASGASVSVHGGYAELDAPDNRIADLRTKSIFSRDIAIGYQVISTGKQDDGSGKIGASYGDGALTSNYRFDLEHSSYAHFCIRKYSGTQKDNDRTVLIKDTSVSLRDNMGEMYFIEKIGKQLIESKGIISGRTYTAQTTDKEYSNKKISLWSSETIDVKVDYIFVRKYNSPGPTITVKAEQSSPIITPVPTTSPTTFASAKTAIAAAKTKISEANTRGSDTAQAELLLEEAEQAFESGDYNKAKELANEAKKKAERVILAHNILIATVIAVAIFIVVNSLRILKKK